MPRTVTIHDPLTGRKPEVGTMAIPQGPPPPVRGKVYIILNTVDGVTGAHVGGAFSDPNLPVKMVRSLSGDKTYQIGGPPARKGDEMWDVVTSDVVESCP